MRTVVVVVLLLISPACGGGGSGSSAERAITAFDTDPVEVDASFRAIHGELEARPAKLRAAALEHLDSDDFAVHYAALYSLAITAEMGPSMRALTPYLRSSDVSERMLAAGSLAFRGDKASLPVLIAALGSDQRLRFRRPPEEAWRFARSLLIQFTNEDLGLIGKNVSQAQAAAARRGWEDWWETRGGSLRWDGATGRYTP